MASIAHPALGGNGLQQILHAHKPNDPVEVGDEAEHCRQRQEQQHRDRHHRGELLCRSNGRSIADDDDQSEHEVGEKEAERHAGHPGSDEHANGARRVLTGCQLDGHQGGREYHRNEGQHRRRNGSGEVGRGTRIAHQIESHLDACADPTVQPDTQVGRSDRQHSENRRNEPQRHADPLPEIGQPQRLRDVQEVLSPVRFFQFRSSLIADVIEPGSARVVPAEIEANFRQAS